MRSTTTNTSPVTIHIQATSADPIPCHILDCDGDRYPGIPCSEADRHDEIREQAEARLQAVELHVFKAGDDNLDALDELLAKYPPKQEKVAEFCSIAGCTRPPYAASHEGVRPDRYTGTVCAKHYDDVVDGRICKDCGEAHEEGQTPLCEFDF